MGRGGRGRGAVAKAQPGAGRVLALPAASAAAASTGQELVNAENAGLMAAFEDALNVVLAHPLFQNVHSTQPAAIDGTARVEEAGSQARAVDTISRRSNKHVGKRVAKVLRPAHSLLFLLLFS